MYDAPELESIHYLPSEEVNKRNFPEIEQFQEEISLIFLYATVVDTAIEAYRNSEADKIDVNAEELKQCIDLTRTVCIALGKAPTVCFDVLQKLRSFLYSFQQLAYLADQHGVQYVGQPTVKGGV